MNVKDHIQRISIVGSGNVAHNFGLAFKQAGFLINEIFSRNSEKAKSLGEKLRANHQTDLNQLDPNSDLYIIAVSDDALSEVIGSFPFKDKLTVHTSGANSMEFFEEHGYTNYGIFYPVQSLSKEDTESLSPIPICVEAEIKETENLLMSFGRSLSMRVYPLDSPKRKSLHVAAVFANNFSNHMFSIAEELLEDKKIDFEIIRPLIERTANKIKKNDPKVVQTGPAKRKDQKTIQGHIDYLGSYPEYQEIYKMLTDSIIKKQNS